MTHDELVAEIVAAAGGEIVGRIRFQKIIYLLDQKGLRANASFHYHHYGPYSRIIDSAIEKAKAFRNVSEIIKYRNSDGAPFSVFITGVPVAHGRVGALASPDLSNLLQRLKRDTSTVLELAATIHWLVNSEGLVDWRSEIIRRKGVKTQGGRIDQALLLLRDLQLSPS